jgi:hypothetical protein
MIDDWEHCGKPFKYWEAGAGDWRSSSTVTGARR